MTEGIHVETAHQPVPRRPCAVEAGLRHEDTTIRARFHTYRFADHKERVVDVLARVTRVSVETQAIVAAMGAEPRSGFLHHNR